MPPSLSARLCLPSRFIVDFIRSLWIAYSSHRRLKAAANPITYCEHTSACAGSVLTTLTNIRRRLCAKNYALSFIRITDARRDFIGLSSSNKARSVADSCICCKPNFLKICKLLGEDTEGSFRGLRRKGARGNFGVD